MSARRAAAALWTVAVAGACSDDAAPVPEHPTWFADVQPIMKVSCGMCHGPRPVDARVAGIRLDRYVALDDTTLDAWDLREAIIRQAVDREAPAMPPTTILEERSRLVLAGWLADGAPKGTRANTAPTAVLVGGAAPAAVDQALSLTVDAHDDDRDPVIGTLVLRDADSGAAIATGPTFGNETAELTFDTGQVGSGVTVDVSAILDDAWSDDPAQNQHEVVLARGITIDHGALGTAPTVRLLSPNGGAAILGATPISWAATDPDPGDTLSIDLDLLRVGAGGNAPVVDSIAAGLSGTSTFTWDPAGVPTEAGGVAIEYRVRVTATDTSGPNVRSDESDASFTIAPEGGPTGLTWADVKPIFVTYCAACHGQPARSVALESFRLDKYDAADPEPPANGDLGVHEMRSAVFMRLVTQGNMPPMAAPQPPAADVAKVRDWILGGAPRDGVVGDGPPSVTWTTPNDTTITSTTTGTVTLVWSATDPEGQPLTGAISYARIDANADAMARCDANTTGWVDLAVPLAAGSLSWAVPGQGYFCLRARAVDAANQATVRIAARPVKYRPMGGP